MTAVAKATAATEAVLKEDSADEKRDTDGGSGETKEFDLTAVAKATAETEAVHKEDSAEEINTDDWFGES